MNKIKNYIFVFILGGIICSSVVAYANIKYNANEVGYKETTVEQALNDLYNLQKNSCGVPSIPNLNDNLIPIKISNNGEVKYVNKNTRWYDYCNKEWANSVMHIDNPSKSYNYGDTIKEEDIKGYFVWIPKYKYKLWNVSTTNPSKGVHSIDIVFDTNNTTDEEGVSCATPMTANNSGNCNDGEYMTHPAFISMNVNGFWVGKFEITGSIDNITVKPGLSSVRNQPVKAFFEKLYNYSRENNSHMMKNTEWGAVAYLSHSKYGIGLEVNINNNSSCITGMSALPSTDQHSIPNTNGNGSTYNLAYNTKIGYLASTTGNISGIYDMSGGSWEYMVAYRGGTYGSSGFNASTIANYDSKYFDVYPSNSEISTHQYRILGDATGEMGPIIYYKDDDGESRYHNKWYSDMSHFVESSCPWFIRGGRYHGGVIAGQFSLHNYTGGVYEYNSARLVLSP